MLFHIAKHQIASIVLMLAAAATGSGLTACTVTTNSEPKPVATITASQTARQVEKPMQGMDHSSSMMSNGASHGSMNLGVADADYDLRFIDGVTI